MKVFSKISLVNELILNKKIGFIKAFADDKTIIANTSELNLSPEGLVNYLQEFLDGLEGEYIQIALYKNEKDNFPLKHYIKINAESSTSKQTENAPNNTIIGLLNQMQQLRLDMQAEAHKREVEKISEELERIKKSKEKTPNPVYEKLFAIGAELLKRGNTTGAPAPAPVTVVSSAPAPAPVASPGIFGTGEKEKFQDLVKRWHKADAQFLETMEKIVKIAEKNPDTYNLYKNYLTE